MNGRQHRAIIERERSRLIEEARGDINLALDASIAERYITSEWVSAGFVRARPATLARLPKLPPPSIEDPGTGPEDQAGTISDP